MQQQMLRVSDFPTKKAVQQHLEHSVATLNGETERILPGAVTMGMLADRYIKEYLPDLAKSTRDTWEGVLKLHVRPHWDKVPALAVKPLLDRAMYWELIPIVTNPIKLVKVRGVMKREKKLYC